MYAYDFDGVIGDTKTEIAVVAFNAYATLAGDKILPELLTASNYSHFLRRYRNVFKRFYDLTAYASCAQHYFFNCLCIRKKVEIRDDADFVRKLKAVPEETQAKWQKEFYHQRHLLHRKDDWLSLVGPFPEALSFVKSHPGIILTNKDEKTVSLLLARFGIPYSTEKIFGNRLGNDKNKKLLLISTRIHAALPQIIFLDDNLHNLLDARKLKVRCILAGWGMNNEEQRKLARKKGIRVMTLKELSNL